MRDHSPFYNSREEQYAAFNKDKEMFDQGFGQLWKADDEMPALILKCHLIIEQYMTDCFLASFPGMGDVESARLSFSQKFFLMDPITWGFPWIERGVAEINKIRNKMAHRLGYRITEGDLKNVYLIVNVLRKEQGLKKLSGVEAITEFTKTAAFTLYFWSTKIRRHTPSTGSQGYNFLEWLGRNEEDLRSERRQ